MNETWKSLSLGLAMFYFFAERDLSILALVGFCSRLLFILERIQ